jgi:hypothetical protein
MNLESTTASQTKMLKKLYKTYDPKSQTKMCFTDL